MLRVLIVGAGVSGGVIARGLKSVPGIEVIAVEQVARDAHANAGNGLNIGPNALKALDVVMPDMAAELRARSLPWTRWKANLVSGEPVLEIPLAEVADRAGLRIRWADLYGVARGAIAAVTHFDEALVALDYHGAAGSRIGVELEQAGTGARRRIDGIDLLIACDGRFSRVRELCMGAPVATHLEVANFRVLIDERAFDGVADLDAWDMEQWFNGPHRLLAYRLPGGSVYLSGTVPLAAMAALSGDAVSATAALHRAYLDSAAPPLEVCQRLVEATRASLDNLHWSRMQQIPVCFRDAPGRVLLVGDSAHAMAPTLGQGATQAIEDGCAFVDLLARRAADGPVDVPRLTADFERLRRDRIEFARRLSWHASTPMLAGSDPVATHRALDTPDYRDRLRRLYLDPLQTGIC